jgi:hypothetical protein
MKWGVLYLNTLRGVLELKSAGVNFEQSVWTKVHGWNHDKNHDNEGGVSCHGLQYDD